MKIQACKPWTLFSVNWKFWTHRILLVLHSHDMLKRAISHFVRKIQSVNYFAWTTWFTHTFVCTCLIHTNFMISKSIPWGPQEPPQIDRNVFADACMSFRVSQRISRWTERSPRYAKILSNALNVDPELETHLFSAHMRQVVNNWCQLRKYCTRLWHDHISQYELLYCNSVLDCP